jgi:hypothetical protein
MSQLRNLLFTMPLRLLCVASAAVFCVLVGASSGDATATMHLAGCDYDPYRLVLVQFQNRILDRSIEIDLPNFWMLGRMEDTREWMELDGWECSGPREFPMPCPTSNQPAV